MSSPHKSSLPEDDPKDRSSSPIFAFRFPEFLDFLGRQLNLSDIQKTALLKISPASPYDICETLKIPSESLARYFSLFCSFDFLPFVNPETVQVNLLTSAFCKANSVIPLKIGGRLLFAISNPFRFDMFDVLTNKFQDLPHSFAIADPKMISFLLVDEETTTLSFMKTPRAVDTLHSTTDGNESPIALIADNILYTAVQHRASDIHIEPKESHVLVRFRIDGDMKEIYGLNPETGHRLLSRLKVFGNLDIAERRKPQDGMIEAEIAGNKFKLRLATTSTPRGESMIIRLLDQSMKAPLLGYLGLTGKQVETLTGLARRERGLILIVGSTGSGKTTTIYSLLSQIDSKVKSLITVEDPVEYKIPFANQQQVNEKAGITFESVLKSSMRQDPDILFLGEVRDTFSAKAAMDFASTGHMTITTLHTSNATTAIFRLERLGVARSAIADSVIAIVAQRLLKKLCEACSQVSAPDDEEIKMLKSFSEEIPEKVARPVGCPKCGGTGYWGREGIYEILEFDPETAMMIRSGRSIAEIRNFTKRKGSFLISHHAVEKVKTLKFSVKDVYEKVLVEEPVSDVEFMPPPESSIEKDLPARKIEPVKEEPVQARPEGKYSPPSILIVEDEKDTRALLSRYLENRGYKVTIAEDGIDALLCLGKRTFDLIISDVNMPNLDGFKLIEMANQKGISAPILFLTARIEEENERKGFELGAVDYIKKPIQKEVLILRIERILKGKR